VLQLHVPQTCPCLGWRHPCCVCGLHCRRPRHSPSTPPPPCLHPAKCPLGRPHARCAPVALCTVLVLCCCTVLCCCMVFVYVIVVVVGVDLGCACVVSVFACAGAGAVLLHGVCVCDCCFGGGVHGVCLSMLVRGAWCCRWCLSVASDSRIHSPRSSRVALVLPCCSMSQSPPFPSPSRLLPRCQHWGPDNVYYPGFPHPDPRICTELIGDPSLPRLQRAQSFARSPKLPDPKVVAPGAVYEVCVAAA
jgi:hypothetical protein